MNGVAAADFILKRLAEHGLFQTELESRGGLLIVKLPPEQRSRLLADADLRKSLTALAKQSGFTHIALELNTEL